MSRAPAIEGLRAKLWRPSSAGNVNQRASAVTLTASGTVALMPVGAILLAVAARIVGLVVRRRNGAAIRAP